jgi:hypothetical protein
VEEIPPVEDVPLLKGMPPLLEAPPVPVVPAIGGIPPVLGTLLVVPPKRPGMPPVIEVAPPMELVVPPGELEEPSLLVARSPVPPALPSGPL